MTVAGQPRIDDVLDEIGLAAADVPDLLASVRDLVSDEVEAVVAEGADAIPEIRFDDLASLAGGPLADRVRRRGCVVVRGAFDEDEARAWDREIGDYLSRNRFDEVYAAAHPDAAATGSRIWGVYWSRPQVAARQHDRMQAVRSALDGLWRHRDAAGTEWFAPGDDIGYPDRIRRRAPGVTARGLAPHVDAPSAGGWRVPENRAVFAEVLAGRPEAHDPFDAAHRTALDVESPVGCTVFRTFQGWTALSETRPSDGGLSIVPVPLAVAYLVVAGIARDLGLTGEPGPSPRRAGDDPLFEPALTAVPTVRPGDTVWWHGDLVHAVADATNDTRWSNVMYIGSSPRCPRNDVYAETAYERFLSGRSPRDFPAEDFETRFSGRATPDDLDDRGRRQFGIPARGRPR